MADFRCTLEWCRLVQGLYSHITAFEVKLRLWEAQLAAGQFMHFPCIVVCAPDDVDLNTCVGIVTSLREEFGSRFTGVRPLATGFNLFTSLYDFPVDEAPGLLEMELVELQCNDELKAKYRSAFSLSFRYLVLPSNKLSNYTEHVKCIVAMFGNTYCFEQLFKKNEIYKVSHSLPAIRIAISMTFCSCLSHQSIQTLTHFSMANSTSHYTNIFFLSYIRGAGRLNGGLRWLAFAR